MFIHFEIHPLFMNSSFLSFPSSCCICLCFLICVLVLLFCLSLGDAQFSEAVGYPMVQQWRVRSNLYKVKLSSITLSTGQCLNFLTSQSATHTRHSSDQSPIQVLSSFYCLLPAHRALIYILCIFCLLYRSFSFSFLH